MTNDEELYTVEVFDGMRQQRWLSITGRRDTVLTAALAVILDNAPPFNPRANPVTPAFSVAVWKVKP